MTGLKSEPMKGGNGRMEQRVLGATLNVEAAAQRIASSNAMVVGLDLSLTATGYYLWSINQGNISTPGQGVITNKLRDMERMDHILKALMFELDDAASASMHVYIEDFAFGVKQNQSYVREIGMLHGLVRHWLWGKKIHTVMVPPTVLKKFVTGSGAAKKEVMMLDVYKRFGFEARDNNLADAFGLAAFGRAVEGLWDKELLSFQKETVDKFRSTRESEDF